ncbi:MAG: LPS-assembly protein LptD [Candidatus Lambdaproteobacteria bacterium]|nr:LPS-assembly protein LptD [Candidatus Lambdaproteobacteria bacterium]
MRRIGWALVAAIALLGKGGLPLWPGSSGLAHAVEIRIDTPTFEYDERTKTYRYQDARVQLGELTIDASEIEIETETSRIRATGAVRFSQGRLYGVARRLELDGQTGMGTFFEGQLYDTQSGYTIAGEQIVQVDEKHFRASRCTITNCRPPDTGWRVSASLVDYYPGEFAVARNFTLQVGGVPVFWFPIVAWPTVDERRSGVLPPRLAFHSSSLTRLKLNNRLSFPVFWALGVDHDLTLYPEYIERRGGALGTEYAYAFREDQSGLVRLWGISEAVARALEIENTLPSIDLAQQTRHPARFTFDWNHTQALGAATRLTWSAARSSDGQVRREYDRLENYRPALVAEGTLSHQSSWGDGAISLTRAAEYSEESLFANRTAFTDEKQRPLQAPRLVFSTGGRLFSKLELGMQLSATATRFATEQGVSGTAYTASPTLTLPIPLVGSMELRTNLVRRFVQYQGLTRRFIPEPGANAPDELALDPQAYAQSGMEVEWRWPWSRDFRGEGSTLRHRFTPRLLYAEVEDVAQPLAGSLVFCNLNTSATCPPEASQSLHRDPASGEIRPLDPVSGVIRPLFAQRLATFRFDNTWERRVGDGAPRSVATLNLIQRYNLLLADKTFEHKGPKLPCPLESALTPDCTAENPPGKPLLPAIVEGTLRGRGYGLGLTLRYDHELARVVETRIGLEGQIIPHSNLAVSYYQNDFTYRTPDDKLNPAASSFGFSSELLVSDTVSMGLSGTVNMAKQPAPLDRRIETGLAFLDYHPGCYGLRLSYQEQVSLTTQRGQPLYILDRTLLLTVNLGNAVSGSRSLLPWQGL